MYIRKLFHAFYLGCMNLLLYVNLYHHITNLESQSFLFRKRLNYNVPTRMLLLIGYINW